MGVGIARQFLETWIFPDYEGTNGGRMMSLWLILYQEINKSLPRNNIVYMQIFCLWLRWSSIWFLDTKYNVGLNIYSVACNFIVRECVGGDVGCASGLKLMTGSTKISNIVRKNNILSYYLISTKNQWVTVKALGWHWPSHVGLSIFGNNKISFSYFL